MIIDFHSHILPAIDDGAKDLMMSKRMLEMQRDSGVKAIVATPHFYMFEQSVEDFLQNRNDAYNQIKPESQKIGIDIHLGAEVYFTPSLIDIDLKKLCIENTNYMMIELPYQNFSEIFIRSFKSFVGNISSEINLILAHAERYIKFTDKESLCEILDTDIIVQLNCESFKRFSPNHKFISELISTGQAHLLGTDCHNITSRAPNMEMARAFIEKKFSRGVFDKFMDNARRIVSGEII